MVIHKFLAFPVLQKFLGNIFSFEQKLYSKQLLSTRDAFSLFHKLLLLL